MTAGGGGIFCGVSFSFTASDKLANVGLPLFFFRNRFSIPSWDRGGKNWTSAWKTKQNNDLKSKQSYWFGVATFTHQEHWPEFVRGISFWAVSWQGRIDSGGTTCCWVEAGAWNIHVCRTWDLLAPKRQTSAVIWLRIEVFRFKKQQQQKASGRKQLKLVPERKEKVTLLSQMIAPWMRNPETTVVATKFK